MVYAEWVDLPGYACPGAVEACELCPEAFCVSSGEKKVGVEKLARL